MSRSQKYTLVILLVIFWMGVVFSPVIAKGFQPPPEINAAIPALIGTILAAPTKGEKKNPRIGQSEEDGEGESEE